MYLKFQDSKNVLPVDVTLNRTGNVAKLSFRDKVVVDTSGFDLFVDENGEYNIGGKAYHNFNFIYRNDEDTAQYNGYQLSNDGSKYEEPVIPEPEPEPEKTEEEIREEQRQAKISELYRQIDERKSQLSSTDYIYIKKYEVEVSGEDAAGEYDYATLHVTRQTLRDEINQLQEELQKLVARGGAV